MLNMLVIVENINLGINLINTIAKTNKNVRLYNFCNNTNEAINLLKLYDSIIDFIILEINFQNSFGLEIIDFLKNKNKIKYLNSLILLSDGEFKDNSFIFKSFKRPINIKELIEYINIIHDYKEKSNTYLIIQNKIINELKYLNYNLSHLGTKYLIETILEIYFKENYLGDNLKNNIYSILANKYHKSINTIYGNIKQATIYMYINCKKDIIINYFNLEEFRKPKVTEVIFRVLNNIKKTSSEH